MIYGIGIDIIRITRMKDVVDKWGDKFLKRVFTENETAYCYKKNNPFLSLAARFAAKEAVIKAMGANVTASLTDIEVVNDDSGKPVLKANGNFKVFLRDNKIKHIHLSLSHEKEYSIACAVVEATSELTS